MKKLLTRKIIITFIIFALIGGVGGYWYSHRGGESAQTIHVERRTVARSISVSGATESLHRVDLAFERGGKVERVSADIGTRVVAGETLAVLDSAELRANLLDDGSLLQAEEAKLAELQRGTRLEEVTIQEVKVENAKTMREDAHRNLANQIEDAYTKSDDAVHAQADQFFTNPRIRPQLNLVIGDMQLKIDLETRRENLETILKSWQESFLTLENGEDAASVALNLDDIRAFLNQLSKAINALTPTANLTQATIDAYRASLSGARANINIAVTNLSNGYEKLRSAGSALTLAQNELLLARAGSTPGEIAAQEARVGQAKARIAATRAQIAKGIIQSPIAGVVTKRDIEPGEVAAANAIVFSIISETGLQIKVFVPEVEVADVSLGNPADITFDAFPEEKFSGTVGYIDPAETVRDGVVNFKVTVSINQKDARLKSGLTANLKIQTLLKEHVLTLPQFAILEKGGRSFARKLEGQTVREVAITIGAKSDDGRVEILSGLAEGDAVENIAGGSNAKN